MKINSKHFVPDAGKQKINKIIGNLIFPIFIILVKIYTYKYYAYLKGYKQMKI